MEKSRKESIIDLVQRVRSFAERNGWEEVNSDQSDPRTATFTFSRGDVTYEVIVITAAISTKRRAV